MSDEDERALWRKAMEGSPSVVKWLESRLRHIETGTVAPIFYRSPNLKLSMEPYQNVHGTIPFPLMNGFPDFKVVGMSLWTPPRFTDFIDSLGDSVIRIYLPFDQIIEQPTRVLLIPSLPKFDASFNPGWLVNAILPPASTIRVEFTNPVGIDLILHFMIHGSFETDEKLLSLNMVNNDFGLA